MSFKLSLFEQPNPIWCFVFVTLFNLQGTHRFAAAGVILPHRFNLVKSFLEFFQTFFSSSGQPGRLLLFSSPSQATRLVYHISVRLSRTFFAPSGGFLFSHSSSLLIWKTSLSSGICPPRRALAYNIRLTPDCQLFFSIFFIFFPG